MLEKRQIGIAVLVFGVAALALMVLLVWAIAAPANAEVIPIDLEIRHRGSLEVLGYEFRVVYHRSPTSRWVVSYWSPPHPKYSLIRYQRKGRYYVPPTVRVWLIPPDGCYQFDVFVRVVGKGYNSAWSDPATMVSTGYE